MYCEKITYTIVHRVEYEAQVYARCEKEKAYLSAPIILTVMAHATPTNPKPLSSVSSTPSTTTKQQDDGTKQ